MRILMVYNYLPTQTGGVETVIDALATRYAREGHEVTALGADIPERDVRNTPTEYRVVGVAAANGLERRAGIPWPIFHPRLANVLREETARADVIYGHGFLCAPTIGAFALARLRRARAPTCVLVEHVGFVAYESPVLSATERVAIQTLGRAATRLADGAIVINPRVTGELKALSPATPVEWIPNGVDLEMYRPALADERRALRHQLGWDERPRVLFVGRITPKKGLDIVLEVARLGRGTFEVVVAGPCDLADGAPPNVRILGPMPRDRVAALYRAADAFLLPSYGEGFPLTALEALASGCPALLGEDPSYGAYVDGAGTAIQLVPRDAAEITRRLEALFATEGALARASADALTHARERFSWERTARAHEAFAEHVRRRPQ